MITNVLRATVCVSVIVAPAIVAALIPQLDAQDSIRTIEAASIRPALFPSESSFAGWAAGAGDVCNIGTRRPLASGNRLTLGKITLCQLIAMGYDVQSFRIADLPPQMRKLEASNFYDVQIKAEGDQPLTDDQSRALLRDLVKDRFHVALHRDTRDLPVYVLAIGKNGTKLHETSDYGQTQRTGVPIASYIAFISRYVDRPIVDKTGLTGSDERDSHEGVFPRRCPSAVNSQTVGSLEVNSVKPMKLVGQGGGRLASKTPIGNS
jgi:uncharacterized protein (TIGR03435 family)